MLTIMILLMFLMMLPFILMSINFFFFKKKNKNREKNSPFECGFDPLNNTRVPMSIQFFLISLIFLIFDIEITLLMPLIFSFSKFNKFLIMNLFIFIFILMFGIYVEYLEQSLDWKD